MIHEITILDSVWTEIDKPTAKLVKPILSCQKKIWGRGEQGFTFETISVAEYVGNGKYIFPTGLLSRVINFLGKRRYEWKINETHLNEIEFDEPFIEGIDFRDYQIGLVNIALENGRGVIVAPTATGKSYIILGIISALTLENVLLLVHTKDLKNQLLADLKKFNFNDIGEWSGSRKKLGRITVATVQSYINIAEKNVNKWDCIIIDEGHHVSKIDGQYARVLSMSLAPMKLALTATLPYLPEAKLTLEGFVGPVIGEYTKKDAAEDGVLAKPKIVIREVPPLPWNHLFDEADFEKKPMHDYITVYHNGIVHNENRNLMVLVDAERQVKKGRTVLINVVKIPHGEILLELAKEYFKFKNIEFVYGKTKNRKEILERFQNKEIDVVIATTVFNEGINIPSLGCCINAAGGKSEIATLQKIGRVLRKTEDQPYVIIIDYMDTCHYLLKNQYTKRKNMYIKNGWL